MEADGENKEDYEKEEEEEKGNSKKNQLEIKREFLNMVYSSFYMRAGALCSTSIVLVLLECYYDTFPTIDNSIT